jgi:hypothetical protein
MTLMTPELFLLAKELTCDGSIESKCHNVRLESFESQLPRMYNVSPLPLGHTICQ